MLQSAECNKSEGRGARQRLRSQSGNSLLIAFGRFFWRFSLSPSSYPIESLPIDSHHQSHATADDENSRDGQQPTAKSAIP